MTKSRLIEIIQSTQLYRQSNYVGRPKGTEELADSILSSGFVHKDEIDVCDECDGIKTICSKDCPKCLGKGWYIKEEK